MKLLGITLVGLLFIGAVSSCKPQHELCPAYTKADLDAANQAG